MTAGVTTKEAAREALLETQRYLADEIAPMMAVEAIETLLRMPSEYGALAIKHWLEGQLSAPDRAVTVGNYLYHAVKKIYAFAEYGLIDPRSIKRYIAELSRLVARQCPEREQAELRMKLSRIGECETKLSAPLRLLHRELGNQEDEQRIARIVKEEKRNPTPKTKAGRETIITPRTATLMDRLGGMLATACKEDGDDKAKQVSSEVLASLVSNAALESNDTEQFESSLDRVRKLGVDPKLDEVFRQLGKRLPGWEVDPAPGKGEDFETLGHLLKAMHGIVALAGTQEEGTSRFNSMVYAAIEQFNDGHLAQAVAMFDVAQRLIDEGKFDTHLAVVVRQRAEESVSLQALRRFASTPAKHGLLRKVLRFFGAFSPQALLGKLDGQPKREVRKLILALLEVHGPLCRPDILERLGGYLSGQVHDERSYYSRNMVFLLRRMPRSADDDQEQELQLLTEYSQPKHPFMVTKEAVGALALLTLPQAETVLLERLTDFEQQARAGNSLYTSEETEEILDRTCASLAKLGTRQTVRRVIEHALRTDPQLGETMPRLQHLGACNLNRDPDQVRKLIESLRKMLPAKVLGIVLGRRVREAARLVRALSGTPEPEVHQMFEEIIERFPGLEIAEQAREALARFRTGNSPESKSIKSLTGDLELFALPNLLQSMGDSEQMGRLTITESNGSDRAVFHLQKGKIVRCEVGRLRGLDAVCQLFERPKPGTFSFEPISTGEVAAQGQKPLDVMSTIMEAMRRYDEFQHDRAVVPDGSSMMPADAKPTVPKTESDKAFVQTVWHEAARGTAPESCEGGTGDAYRVRRLFLHWFETGALALRPTA
jgi:hypothetical protein